MRSTNNTQTVLPQTPENSWCASCALKSKSRSTVAFEGLSTIDKRIELCFLEKQLTALEQDYEAKAKACLRTPAPMKAPKPQNPQAAPALPPSDCTVAQFSEQLRHQGVSMGRNTLYAWLRQSGYLYKRPGGGYRVTREAANLELVTLNWIPCQYLNKNQVLVRDHYAQIRVTPKGQYLFTKVLQWEQEVQA